MTSAVPLKEPETAIMVAVPSATAVTSPAVDTVATEASDVAHVTVAPEITDPPASFTVAVSVAVSANEAKLRLVGDRVTDHATRVTVVVAVALTDPEVAVIVAVPLPIAVTKPPDETVAMSVSDELHVTVGLTIVLSFASFTVAVRVAVSPPDPAAASSAVHAAAATP